MQIFENWTAVLIDFIPVLLVIAVVTAMARLAHWLIRYKQGKKSESDPFPRQFVTLIAVIIAIISVVLVMPIDVSVRNHLFTLLGLVLTAVIAFSSTTFAANILAGFTLRATRRLRPGNFISHEGDLGRITEIGLIQTEIQTRHHNFTYLPNTSLLSDKVMVINQEATIVSAEISLGYDVHHGVVEKYLISAAEKCGLEDPHVRVRELGDFSITYRIAGMLREVKLLITTGSDLRKAMLDCLHEAGIEIVSPAFMNQRPLAPEQVFIPQAPANGSKPAPVSTTDAPENVIFDKADEAERIENLKDHREQLLSRVKELEADLGKMEDSHKARARQEIEASNARIKGLDAILNSKEE
jgi:small-conductance mechanosensitive channel